MVAHALSSRVPAPRRLQSVVSALHGRLSVVNPTHSARLPAGLAAAVHGLIRVGFDGAALLAKNGWDALGLHPYARGYSRVRPGTDPRGTYELRMARSLMNGLRTETRDQLAEGVTWAALALYEASRPTIRLTPSGGTDASDGTPSAVAMAEIGYRLVIVAGTAPLGDWEELDHAVGSAPATPWPIPRRARQGGGHEQDADRSPAWFAAPLLVPDAWLAAHADPETLAHWARLTGRSGGPDRYWFPETWDRFLEPGRRVGWLTVNDVWRPRRGRLASAASPRAVEDDDDLPANRFGAMTLTPDLERGVGVPPGYAFVQCVGTLDVSVVVTR
jgi:hypothetical protein